jgi:cell division protein FtsN
LRDARRLADPTDIELLNQIDYYARPCEGIEADARARADSIVADSTRRATEQANAPKGRWSVQVAAYGSKADAEALAKRLRARGHDARVTPAKPWRVRVGYYATRADASAAAKELSTKSSRAIVVEAEGRR